MFKVHEQEYVVTGEEQASEVISYDSRCAPQKDLLSGTINREDSL